MNQAKVGRLARGDEDTLLTDREQRSLMTAKWVGGRTGLAVDDWLKAQDRKTRTLLAAQYEKKLAEADKRWYDACERYSQGFGEVIKGMRLSQEE